METQRFEPVTPAPARVVANDGATQLTKLSSILNGLESGACMMRKHVQEAMVAVRSGTYKVDPVQLSQRIISEAVRTDPLPL